MSQQTLMLIEATGIQSYLFGSNQLAQNIGASELVRQATEEWVDELAQGARVVYAGGGNAMLIFESDEAAKGFAWKLTRRVLERARGLDLVVKRKPFNAQEDSLAELHQALREELAQRKRDRSLSTPLAGLGVTAACVYTGAPAVEVHEEQLISVEVQHKLAAEEAGKKRLKAQLPQVKRAGYEFVYNFNEFGTRGEASYLAVIHTDGNRMGERIKKIGADYGQPEQNEQYAQALGVFSDEVKQAANEALNATADALLSAIEETEKGKRIGGVVPIPLRKSDRKPLLPFRPIVFGGDDVTFVCEGRLGLAVAAKYLSVFSQKVLSCDDQLAHARAGVAVVKSHYPFSRAYDLAEALCASAKKYIKEAQAPDGLTALDWHFAVSGLVLPLGQVRKRECAVPTGSLLMRPLRLNPPSGDWRSWDVFTGLLAGFERKPWAGRRSKVKALRDALREGREAVQHFLRLHRLNLPPVSGEPDMVACGWHSSGRCGYWDAVEALDFFVPLGGGLAR